mmetsp:Transcript_10544/g.14716  ORF Transcript_10544/g.14716 Transcript_10544/m.14716 type:complete len:212 (-) Transcript_10544:639-1274(-)
MGSSGRSVKPTSSRHPGRLRRLPPGPWAMTLCSSRFTASSAAATSSLRLRSRWPTGWRPGATTASCSTLSWRQRAATTCWSPPSGPSTSCTSSSTSSRASASSAARWTVGRRRTWRPCARPAAPGPCSPCSPTCTGWPACPTWWPSWRRTGTASPRRRACPTCTSCWGTSLWWASAGWSACSATTTPRWRCLAPSTRRTRASCSPPAWPAT